jgi:hypothetical protein
MTEPTHKSTAIIERGEISENMHPVVKAAMAHGPDPETLRELLAVQREWEANEARKAYAAALVELKTDLPTVIKKDATVDFKSSKGRTFYTHASLAGVMDAITEPLTKHGFSLTWTPSNEQKITVTCRMTHAAGHFEEATLSAPPDASGNKNPVQQVASTVTYLQRYTALALLGIATADMPDVDDGKPEPNHVDADRNLLAVQTIKKHGKKVQDAEARVGRAEAMQDQDRIRDHPTRACRDRRRPRQRRRRDAERRAW